MPKPKNKGQGHSGSMQTPPFAVWPLFEFLSKDWVLWESACGKGYLVDELLANGYKVKWSDIDRDLREDFFTFQPKYFDCQVTNPPFNIKNAWLKRSYELGKPFALLLPIEALSQPDRQAMYRKYGLEIILVDHRLHFETPGESGSSWLDTCWYTWQLNIGRSITYYEFDKIRWSEANETWKSHLASTRTTPKKRKNSDRD